MSPFETDVNVIARYQNSNSKKNTKKSKNPSYYTAVGTPFRKSPTPSSSYDSNSGSTTLFKPIPYTPTGFLTL